MEKVEQELKHSRTHSQRVALRGTYLEVCKLDQADCLRNGPPRKFRRKVSDIIVAQGRVKPLVAVRRRHFQEGFNNNGLCAQGRVVLLPEVSCGTRSIRWPKSVSNLG